MARLKDTIFGIVLGIAGNAAYAALASGTFLTAMVAILAKLLKAPPTLIDGAIPALVSFVVFGLLYALFTMLQRRGLWPVSGAVLPSDVALPVLKVRTVREWSGYQTEQIINRKFEASELVMDGKQFVNCTFRHMRLFYDGTAPMALTGCDFDEDTANHFLTHSPAIAQWTENLRALGKLQAGVQFAMTPLDQLNPQELQAENLRRTGKPNV